MAKKMTEEEFAKLTPEQRNVILEERKRQAEEKRKKEEELEKKNKKESRLSWLFILLPILGFGGIALVDSLTPSNEEKFEKCLENYQFTEARKVLSKMENEQKDDKENDVNLTILGYKERLTQAEISYFIDEGDLSKAFDCAKEGGVRATKHYETTVLSRIPQVYDEKGASALIKFLGSIVFPEKKGTPIYSEEYIEAQKDPEMRAMMKQTNEGLNRDYQSFIDSYNTALSNLIRAIEVDGKKEEAAALKAMLK